MKKLLLIPSILVLFSCSSQKGGELSKATSTLDCPDEGTCTARIEKNKSLDIKTDEFGGIYYNLIDDPTKHVIVYDFSKGFDEQLQDSGYREEILVEIDA